MNESLSEAGYESNAKPGTPNPVTLYFRTLKEVLLRPTAFFRNLKLPTGIAGPLFFGILTHWIGSALAYLWYTGLGAFFGTRLSDLFQALDKSAEIDSSGKAGAVLAMRTKIMDWAFGVSSVLIDPFKTVAWIIFISFFIWIAARIFANLSQNGAEDRLSYSTAVAIVSYAGAAAIFKGIPVVGGFVAFVLGMVLFVVAAKEVYRVGTGRAILIAFFPTLLFWGMILATVVAFFSAIVMLIMR